MTNSALESTETIGRSPSTMAGEQLVFIVGQYKSGSSWLANLLGLHPDMQAVRETHVFRHSLESTDLASCTQKMFEQVAWANGGRKNLVRHKVGNLIQPFRRSGQSSLSWRERPATLHDLSLWQQRKLRATLDQAADPVDYQVRFFRFLVDAFKPRRYLVEKTPTNVYYVPQIRELFPDCKLVSIHRDARDVVISDQHHVRRAYGLERSLEESVRRWHAAISAEVAYSASHGIYTLSYEALKADPSGEAHKLLEFLELETEPAIVADMVERSSFGFVTGRSAGQEKASSFYRKGIVGDWRSQLSRSDLETLESIAGDLLVLLGYEETRDVDRWLAGAGLADGEGRGTSS